MSADQRNMAPPRVFVYGLLPIAVLLQGYGHAQVVKDKEPERGSARASSAAANWRAPRSVAVGLRAGQGDAAANIGLGNAATSLRGLYHGAE